MKLKVKNNSLVIIAQTHNPTLLSEGFLQKVDIIESFDDINQNSLIITPPFSQFSFKNGTQFELSLDRLKIESKYDKFPFEVGLKYIKGLPHIKCKAIGINFDVIVSEFEFDKIVNNISKINNSKINSIKYALTCDDNICNIDVNRDKNNMKLRFNFHYEINKTFDEIEMNFITEWEKNTEIFHNFIKELIKN